MKLATHLQRSQSVIVAYCVVFVMSGCAGMVPFFSPVAPGIEMEEEGMYAEAAELYLGLLEEDPSFEEAHARLRVVGPIAIESYLEESYLAWEEGDFSSAMRYVHDAERLRREAGAAGVLLTMPDEVASFREEAARQAAAQLVRRAERAEEEGAWMGARESYLRALHYAPSEMHEELNDSVLDLELRWAESLLLERQFTEAYERLQHVIDRFEENDPRREEAMLLSRAALEGGAQYVALLPLGVADQLAEHVPERLRIELHEALATRFWQEAPTFVRNVSRDAQRRELRRLRYDRNRIPHREAMELGRVLKADLVVLTEIVDFRRAESDRQQEQRSVYFLGSTSSDPDTAYTAERVLLEMDVEVAYRTLDPAFGLVLNEGVVHASVARPLERAVFMGPADRLDLSEEERALFDLEAIARQERTAAKELIDDLVAQLIERVHQHALAQRD